MAHCQRSGTGALGTVLSQHPQLRYFSEIFHPANFGREGNYFTHLSARILADERAVLPDSNEANFTSFLAHEDGSGVVPVIDVKYNSLHHLNGGWHEPLGCPSILHYARVLGAPIIHLTRINLVEVFVSSRLAEVNGVWHTSDGSHAKIRSVFVDPTYLLHFITTASKEQAQLAEWLSGCSNCITFDYSQMFDGDGMLAAEWAARISTVFGVRAFDRRRPTIVKQAPRRLEQSIENYAEITDTLVGTGNEWMLEQGSPAPASVLCHSLHANG